MPRFQDLCKICQDPSFFKDHSTPLSQWYVYPSDMCTPAHISLVICVSPPRWRPVIWLVYPPTRSAPKIKFSTSTRVFNDGSTCKHSYFGSVETWKYKPTKKSSVSHSRHVFLITFEALVQSFSVLWIPTGDTHITSDMCAGVHISRGYTYHCTVTLLMPAVITATVKYMTFAGLQIICFYLKGHMSD